MAGNAGPRPAIASGSSRHSRPARSGEPPCFVDRLGSFPAPWSAAATISPELQRRTEPLRCRARLGGPFAAATISPERQLRTEHRRCRARLGGPVGLEFSQHGADERSVAADHAERERDQLVAPVAHAGEDERFENRDAPGYESL